MRRDILLTAAISLSVILSPFTGRAQETASSDPLTERQIIQRVAASVDRALEYLASRQGPDGTWNPNHAMNALALLAFMGRGHVPGRGPYRDVLERGKRAIMLSQREDGLFVSIKRSHGPMYEHALATLAMAEMYGMDPDPNLESVLRKATQLIVKSQSPNGGWRYNPKPGDHDLSVTVMQVVALRAANNAEIPVPERTIEQAIKYVRSCGNEEGGFGYQNNRNPNPQMSAAGTLSLQLLGQYDDPLVQTTLDDYLADVPIVWKRDKVQYFYYFHYYAIQAQYQAGGKHWNNWHPKIRELLLQQQNADGSWDVPNNTAEKNLGPDKTYWTSMACVILEVYMHFLPAYQR